MVSHIFRGWHRYLKYWASSSTHFFLLGLRVDKVKVFQTVYKEVLTRNTQKLPTLLARGSPVSLNGKASKTAWFNLPNAVTLLFSLSCGGNPKS